MAKTKSTASTSNIENDAKNANTLNNNNNNNGVRVKRKRKSVPRESPSQRSSIYRGVTRHRWTGRYEAHLWDKNCWNESQNKKGRQVYLGAYDDEQAAAHAYDLAALKYWGHDTILNFPLPTYQEELKEMDGQSKEEYIGCLRRKSSGFSRGVSKYRGVARHHHNGRWEARIGRVFGNKYLYLGTYGTQEEAATAYDMAAIEYRGLNAVTNFDLSRYIKWLRPNPDTPSPNPIPVEPNSAPYDHEFSFQPQPQHQHQHHNTAEISSPTIFPQPRPGGPNASSALGLLLQSPKFKEMLEMTSAITGPGPSSPPESESCRPSLGCSFPDDIQTYFECHDSSGYADGDDDAIFADLNTFVSPILHCELDA